MTYQELVSNLAHSGSTPLLMQLFGGQLSALFGVTETAGMPQQTLLSNFGALMSSVVFWLFIAVVLYIALTGIVNQAQSGSFMLQKWSGIWSFVRLGFGITAVVPFPGTQFVSMQALVLAIALLSSSAADLTWKQVLLGASNAGISAQALTTSMDKASTDAYVGALFQYASCVANKLQYANPDQAVDLGSFNPANPGTDNTGATIATLCGGEKFSAFLQNTLSASAPSMPDVTPALGQNLLSSDVLVKWDTYRKQHIEYIQNAAIVDFLQTKLWLFVTSNITALNSGALPLDLITRWQALTEAFNTTLLAKIQAAVSQDASVAAQVFASQAAQYGWISAGNYYRQLAQQQQIVGSALSTALLNAPAAVNLDQQTDLTVSDNMTQFGVDNSQSLLNRALAKTAKTLDPLGLDVFQAGSQTDPMLTMTAFGQKLVGSAEAMIALRQMSKVLSLIPFVGQGINAMLSNSIVDSTLIVIIVAGLLLGTVLPAMPWVIFLFGVVSWLIYVTEMFVAAPFWIVANALPEGGTLVGSVAKKGINNILFITLYPILSLGGLIASLGISWVGMGLVNHYIVIGFKPLWGIGTFSFTFIGMVYVYVMLSWTIMLNSLNLIQAFPRKILTWVSLSEPGLSSFEDAHTALQGGVLSNKSSQTLVGAFDNAMEFEAKRASHGALVQKTRKLKPSDE